jgi:hypothetical protein
MDVLTDPGSFHEVGLLGPQASSGGRGQDPPRRQLVGFAKVDGRDIGVVINDYRRRRLTSATNSKKIGTSAAAPPRRVFLRASMNPPAPACPTRWARAAWQLLGNDPTQFRRSRESPWAAAALDTPLAVGLDAAAPTSR